MHIAYILRFHPSDHPLRKLLLAKAKFKIFSNCHYSKLLKATAALGVLWKGLVMGTSQHWLLQTALSHDDPIGADIVVLGKASRVDYCS
jgi:hypothetical protein